MNAKEEALEEILDIAKRHQLSLSDITRAFKNSSKIESEKSGSIITRLFGYLGGIFILAGIGVYIAMFWGEMNSLVRVTITLGTGFVAFIIAVSCLKDTRYLKVATPLFLIAAFLEPGGIFVFLDEYGSGGDVRIASLVVSFIMCVQQGGTFWSTGRTVLLFMTLIFSAVLFSTGFDLLDIPNELSVLLVGIFLMCTTYAIDKTVHKSITPFWYFLASSCSLWALYDILDEGIVSVLFLGVASFMVFISTYVKSRTILFVSTLAILGYIADFTAEHFADSIGWPVSLIFLGLVLVGLSRYAFKLNQKYMRN